MLVDYLIVGQGICGTLLSYELWKRGRSFVVIDDGNGLSSSRVASGLINPVTGKRHVKSWEYDNFLATALATYRELEECLGASLIRTTEIIQFHNTQDERNIFEEKIQLEPDYLRIGSSELWQSYFQFHFGSGEIGPCYLVNVGTLLDRWREKLLTINALKMELFSWDECSVTADQVTYKDITARKVICCDGVRALNSSYFSLLPFSLNKGEVAIARIPDLPGSSIYKQHYKIVPVKDDLFWVGSSFLWKYKDLLPSQQFRDNITRHLNNWLKLSFEIVDIQAAERPSTADYRPFVGLHPVYNSVGILNGMGTKGYSQAPTFTKQMTELLCDGKDVMPHADVTRFKRILSAKS